MSGASAAMRFSRLRHRAGADQLVVVRFQRRLEKAQDRRLVVDDQDARLGRS